jgi:lipopolysaccharide transport system ATP-binding protein
MKPIIEVKNIGKKYLISHERGGYVTLRDVMTNILKRPFAFVKTKAKRAVGLEKREEFWALRGVDFNVNKGEVIGIIGRNGAGKSTLLKILSQITPPTEGEIVLRGRVGSLLEVGTGFHPELTGRENIFLNGAILGMKRTEIAEKFDAIVEFAGIGKFLDTPVKRYSSGMYVRLAFSVAAHMEPDILIIDEVLAVGDAEFQKKCLGKMREVTQKDGRTILFVSHNLAAVQSLCTKTILLENGKVKKIGPTKEVIEAYTSTVANYVFADRGTASDAAIESIRIIDKDKKMTSEIRLDERSYIEIEYNIRKTVASALLCLHFFTLDNTLLLMSSETDDKPRLLDYKPGKYRALIEIPPFIFNVGNFTFDASIQQPFVKYFDHKRNIPLRVVDSMHNSRLKFSNNAALGLLSVRLNYSTEKRD